MREIRLTFWFLLGFLLISVPMLAFAETIAATPTTNAPGTCYTIGGVNYPGTTPYTACTAAGWYSYTGSGTCRNQAWSQTIPITGCPTTTYSCPAGQNWTLSGTNCMRPDCVAPETRDPADGICKAPVCPTTSETGWYRRGKTQDISGTYCTGGCEYSLALDLGSAEEYYSTSTHIWAQYSRSGTGNTCTANTPPPESSTNPPTEPEKAPPCAIGEGVISTSGGKVTCVPQNTPGADTPKVSKSESKKTYPDGSSATTINVTTCTGEGACSTSSTTVVTNNTSGVSGQAGPTGTTQSDTNKPPQETPDFCAKNPSLQMCKGGMNEEATQKKVQTELERFNNPTATDDTQLTNKGDFEQSKTQALEDEDTKLQNAASGATSIGSVETSKSAWESAMSSGFFTTVTMNGCTPIVSTFAGKTWTLDHCATAEKISNIGAYALWFMTAIGVFVMLTGGRKD